ncbi:MAG TPA: cyclic nucleotide-binding domain-containing protein, partial [Solimonas sp.]|nr:cyclic nucleotide-binding domain-containing protein [Solimonas sp.]
AFYIIVLGSAEVRKGDRRLQALEKGDCFGEIGMLRTLKRSTSVIAGTKVLALKVHDTLLEQTSLRCQLRFYKTFNESLIYRLSMASAKISSLNPVPTIAEIAAASQIPGAV